MSDYKSCDEQSEESYTDCMVWKNKLILLDSQIHSDEFVVYKNGEFFKLTPFVPNSLNMDKVVAPKKYQQTPIFVDLPFDVQEPIVIPNEPYYDEYPVLNNEEVKTNLEVDANKNVFNSTLYPSDI